jgi:protein gp37
LNNTGIIWTEVTWNPASGCKKITSGCAYCYAHTIAEGQRGSPAFRNGFDLTLRPHKLKEPFKLKQPSLIFVNSMSDLFWEEIPDGYRHQIIDVIEQTPQHQYQVLTKREHELLRFSRLRKLPSNFWAGVTIEDQKNAGRADVLRQVDADIRFVSAEPLLSPLAIDWSGISWCITGGESGFHLRTDEKLRDMRGLATFNGSKWEPRADRVDWVRSIRDQCVAAGVKFFHKQWGGSTSHSAGRMLDGRTWDEFPRMPGEKIGIDNEHLRRSIAANARAS